MSRLGVWILFLSVLSGCATEPDAWRERCDLSDRELLARLDLKVITDSLVSGLCPTSDKSRPLINYQPEDSILVTDVVNVQTLVAGTLGLALGDILKGSVHDVCRVPVRQVENVRDFRLNGGGFQGLSRDPERIRDPQFTAPESIVTTFSYQPGKLTLVGKRIVLDDSAVVAITTRTVVWSCSRSLSGSKEFSWDLK
jgi:FlgO protein